jgi:hypothetical protein
MPMWFVFLLRRLGILRADLVIERRTEFPDELPKDLARLVLVESGGNQKWACFSCPGGCGAAINLALNPNHRPRWSVIVDFWRRPTVKPSVHQKNRCGCHFWIRKGRVQWCEGGRPRDAPLGQAIPGKGGQRHAGTN